MKTPDEIRAMRQDVYEQAQRAAAAYAERGTGMTVNEIETAVRLASIAAALNWVLDEDEHPDWEFLGVVTAPE